MTGAGGGRNTFQQTRIKSALPGWLCTTSEADHGPLLQVAAVISSPGSTVPRFNAGPLRDLPLASTAKMVPLLPTGLTLTQCQMPIPLAPGKPPVMMKLSYQPPRRKPY